MSILKILQYPDLRLRRKGHKVTDVKSAKVKKSIKDMLETLANAESCAALSATQLDMEQPPSIIVINPITDDMDDVLCLINPQIITLEGSNTGEEGCLSIFPNNIRAAVKRANKIKVKALDIHGNHIEFETEGYLARCIQHECDHLNGILFIDYLSKLKRYLLEKKILKLRKGAVAI